MSDFIAVPSVPWLEVSPAGEIRLARRDPDLQGKGVTRWATRKGFIMAAAREGGRKVAPKRSFSAAFLVCTAFHGNAPSPSHRIRYRDGNFANCSAANLEWAIVGEPAP